jgi:hypothetical protein
METKQKMKKNNQSVANVAQEATAAEAFEWIALV